MDTKKKLAHLYMLSQKKIENFTHKANNSFFGTEEIDLCSDLFRNNYRYEHLKNRHRNPNIIVATYVATGNLLGQVSQGKL